MNTDFVGLKSSAKISPFSAIRVPLLFGLLALTLGLLIAALPAQSAAMFLLGATALALALWKPALALGLALALGPTRALLAASGYAGLTYDLGQIFFGLAVASWLAHSALRREITLPRLGLLIPLSAFLFIGLLSLFGAANWRDGLTEAIKWLEVIVVLIIAYAEARQGRLSWMLAAILLAGAAQAALGLWQYGLRGLGPESFELPGGHYRAYGTFEQPNPFGGFLGLIWPVALGLALGLWDFGFGTSRLSLFAFRLLPSSFFLLLSAFLLSALYVSFSRGAWLGAAAAGLVMLIFYPRRLTHGLGLGLAALGGGALLLSSGLLPASLTARLAGITDFLNVVDVRGAPITDANFAIVERLAHWQAALEMMRAHPWLGVGLGNYSAAYADYALINWPLSLGHAHNIYLHLWAETGWLGLMAYLSIWLTALALTVRAVRRASGWQRGLALGLLGVWAHLLTHQVVDNLHVNNTDLLLAVELGLACALLPLASAPRLGDSARLHYNAGAVQ